MHLAAHFETRYRHAGYHRSICQSVRDFCENEHIDLVYADLLAMSQYVDRRSRRSCDRRPARFADAARAANTGRPSASGEAGCSHGWG